MKVSRNILVIMSALILLVMLSLILSTLSRESFETIPRLYAQDLKVTDVGEETNCSTLLSEKFSSLARGMSPGQTDIVKKLKNNLYRSTVDGEVYSSGHCIIPTAILKDYEISDDCKIPGLNITLEKTQDTSGVRHIAHGCVVDPSSATFTTTVDYMKNKLEDRNKRLLEEQEIKNKAQKAQNDVTSSSTRSLNEDTTSKKASTASYDARSGYFQSVNPTLQILGQNINNYATHYGSLADYFASLNENLRRALGVDILMVGNGPANMNTNGLDVLQPLTGVDDRVTLMAPFGFDFFVLGTNYSATTYLSSNNFFMFGANSNYIIPGPNLGRMILFGNADRRTNTCHVSRALTSTVAPAANYIRIVLYFQNNYADGQPNAGQYEIKLVRVANSQFIEIRCNRAPLNQGIWNMSDGTRWTGLFGDGFSLGTGESVVIQSESTGTLWNVQKNCFLRLE